jgi:hypothetical protein
MIFSLFKFSGLEEVVGLVGVITVSPVGTEGEGEATGEEVATEVEGDTIMADLLAMVPVTGGTKRRAGRGCTYLVISCKNSHCRTSIFCYCLTFLS